MCKMIKAAKRNECQSHNFYFVLFRLLNNSIKVPIYLNINLLTNSMNLLASAVKHQMEKMYSLNCKYNFISFELQIGSILYRKQFNNEAYY
jgi:hypothetical protein